MSYPIGPLLRALAERMLANLDVIETQAPKWGSDRQDQPPYADTQLLVSMLGIVVFPHEKAPDALAVILDGYDEITDAVKVLHPSNSAGGDGILITGPEGTAKVEPFDRRELARRLRNGIAHFNMIPKGQEGGRFTGVRIWNQTPEGEINLVADVDFDAFRRLARYVLKSLAWPDRDLGLADPPDPMVTAARQMREKAMGGAPSVVGASPKAPKLNDVLWGRLLEAAGGDASVAQQMMERTLKEKFRAAPRSPLR